MKLKLKCLHRSLKKLNNARKETENQIFKEAVEKIESSFLYKNNVMVVHGDNWHEGVIGIVASRLTEKYYRPCVVISVKDGIGKGSARSLDHVDIYESFKAADTYLEKYGGHKLAAGLTILEKNISSFANELNNYAGFSRDEEYNQIRADAVVDIDDIDLKLYDEINKFEPFGSGNQKPLLALQNVSLKNYQEGRHRRKTHKFPGLKGRKEYSRHRIQ